MAVLDQVDTPRERPTPRLPDPHRPIRDITRRRAVLLLLAGVLWAVGWLTGKTWLLLAWTLAALKLGWSDARSVRDRR